MAAAHEEQRVAHKRGAGKSSCKHLEAVAGRAEIVKPVVACCNAESGILRDSFVLTVRGGLLEQAERRAKLAGTEKRFSLQEHCIRGKRTGRILLLKGFYREFSLDRPMKFDLDLCQGKPGILGQWDFRPDFQEFLVSRIRFRKSAEQLVTVSLT